MTSKRENKQCLNIKPKDCQRSEYERNMCIYLVRREGGREINEKNVRKKKRPTGR